MLVARHTDVVWFPIPEGMANSESAATTQRRPHQAAANRTRTNKIRSRVELSEILWPEPPEMLL